MALHNFPIPTVEGCDLRWFLGMRKRAEKFERSGEIVRKLFLLFIGISIAESVLIYIFRVPLFKVFINDKTVVELGSVYINYFVPFFPFFTFGWALVLLSRTHLTATWS